MGDQDDTVMPLTLTGDEGVRTVKQIAGMIEQTLGRGVVISPDGCGFSSASTASTGKGSLGPLSGHLSGKSVTINFQLLSVTSGARISIEVLLKQLHRMGEKVRLIPSPTGSDEAVLWVALDVAAKPLTPSRQRQFLSVIKELEATAKSLDDEMVVAPPAFNKDYEKVAEFIRPVASLDRLPKAYMSHFDRYLNWATEVVDYLKGGLSVGVVASQPVVSDFSMALVATIATQMDQTVGRVITPSVNVQKLGEYAKNAPGWLQVPAVHLTLGSNLHELGGEIQAMLSALSFAAKPVLFSGNYESLQSVLGGGQGGHSSAMMPVVMHAPQVELSLLILFALREAAVSIGGLSASAERDLLLKMEIELKARERDEAVLLVPSMASRSVNAWAKGSHRRQVPLEQYGERLAGLSECFAGLATKPRVSRTVQVAERMQAILLGDALHQTLLNRILGQKKAIDSLVSSLRSQILTRPDHQPLRYIAQGTAGTGKSESAALLAKILDMPLVNIDAASMPDFYTASAQLLGSGRGLVGSHAPGRLEVAAKHQGGVVVEISDLDHAKPEVRSFLADLFLQILETGELQTASGTLFCCANIIFAFTINLPNGQDERLYRSMGFASSDDKDVMQDAITGIKEMLSHAFLSRVGRPILFQPLSGAALAEILENAVAEAVRTAMQRTSMTASRPLLAEGLGLALKEHYNSYLTSFGARGLLDEARALAADAFMRFHATTPNYAGAVEVNFTADGNLIITKELGGSIHE